MLSKFEQILILKDVMLFSCEYFSTCFLLTGSFPCLYIHFEKRILERIFCCKKGLKILRLTVQEISISDYSVSFKKAQNIRSGKHSSAILQVMFFSTFVECLPINELKLTKVNDFAMLIQSDPYFPLLFIHVNVYATLYQYFVFLFHPPFFAL